MNFIWSCFSSAAALEKYSRQFFSFMVRIIEKYFVQIVLERFSWLFWSKFCFLQFDGFLDLDAYDTIALKLKGDGRCYISTVSFLFFEWVFIV